VTALFGKVWYEGYAKAEYVWQSTVDRRLRANSAGALIFGTIKGTLYALLFAMPVAILGALYTSQFMHPSLKGEGQPTVEIMAAAAQRRGGLRRRAVAGVEVERRSCRAAHDRAAALFGTSGVSPGTACPGRSASGSGPAWSWR